MTFYFPIRLFNKNLQLNLFNIIQTNLVFLFLDTYLIFNSKIFRNDRGLEAIKTSFAKSKT